MDEVKGPKNTKYMDAKKNEIQGNIENAFNDYKKLMADKTHPDNQTPAYHKNVVTTLQRLLIAADEMDGVNPGEGIFGLIVLFSTFECFEKYTGIIKHLKLVFRAR